MNIIILSFYSMKLFILIHVVINYIAASAHIGIPADQHVLGILFAGVT